MPTLIIWRYSILQTIEKAWRGFKPRHDHIFRILPDLEINILKLSLLKTVAAAFHLNNREAKHELAVYDNNYDNNNNSYSALSQYNTGRERELLC